MTGDQAAAEAVYARLWEDAQAAFAAGTVQTDPHLDDRAADQRRGLTLVLRPARLMRARIATLIAQLDAIAPGQHIYRPDELHVTVLSLISASEAVQLASIPLEAYHALLTDLCAHTSPLSVHFTSVGASADSVFVCGQTVDDGINALRDRLRARLVQAGLSDGMERRYQSVTTHSTILRYRTIPPDLPRLAAFLTAQHGRDLGAFQVESLELTFNDWYMSHDRVRVLGRYPLSARP